MAIYIGGTGSANQFDDYEEGSWTPVLQAYNGSSWVDVTYDNNRDYGTGKYTKIGKLCQIWYFTGAFSLDGGFNTQTARFNGLPFPFVNNDPYYGGIFQFSHATCFKDTSNNLTDVYTGYGRYNDTYISPNLGNSTSNPRWGSESARYVMLSGIYETNT